MILYSWPHRSWNPSTGNHNPAAVMATKLGVVSPLTSHSPDDVSLGLHQLDATDAATSHFLEPKCFVK